MTPLRSRLFLSRSHPHAVQSLLLNMGRELSLRMRRANRALTELA